MGKKVIEIKDLTFNYPDGTKALESVSLDICENESLGIVGPNGAGKSTLLLHLNGILNGNGNVKILGLEPKGENLNVIRRDVGLVFQDPDDQLFMPAVFDDVAFGPVNMNLPRQEVVSRVDEALRRVEMESRAQRLSHHLSFGEKKRVSVATVLSMRPKILLLDEPTSNLDPKHRKDLMDFLRGLNITKVIATHDLSLVREVCSSVALLDKGRLVASGSVSEILGNENLLNAHFLGQ